MRLRRIWENLRKGSTPDMVAAEQDELVAGLEVAFTALDRIQKAAESFEVLPLLSCSATTPMIGVLFHAECHCHQHLEAAKACDAWLLYACGVPECGT